MPTYHNEDESRAAREQELEDRFYFDSRDEQRRKHEKDLLKIQLSVPKQAIVERIVLAIFKAPAFVVLAVMLPLLVLNDKPIPKPLAEFFK